MPLSDIIKARLLFVDDDRSFLDFLGQTFTEFSHNQWDITCVTDAAHALGALRSKKMDLAVLDLNMPGVNGLQLLRMLKREFPALQMAFLSGQGDKESRRIGLEEGAALFLEKPASLAGMESLFATLNELARWQQRMGERGVIRPAGFLDLVRMECKSGNSRVFEVFGAEERGQIWIKAGVIIHAIAPEKRGQTAFTHLVCLPKSEFHLKPFSEPDEHSVDRESETLVLEAERMLEQMHSATDTAPLEKPIAPTVPRPTLVPPPPPSAAPAPAAAPTRVVAPIIAEKVAPIKPASPTAVPSAHQAAAPAPNVPVVPRTTPPPLPATGFPPVAAAPVTRRLVTEPARAGLRIEEMLVSSDRGDVFYEWQCADPKKWLGLIEFVANKARQLGNGLPLGTFDRIEMQAADGRLVVQQQQNRFVLVRSNTCARLLGAEAFGRKTVAEWLAQQSAARGFLAYGMSLPDRKVLTQSFAPGIPFSALNTAWPCVTDTFETAARIHFPAWQLRWIFDGAQLYCVRRSDGASLGLLLEKEPAAVDLPAVEQFFTEFQTLRLA